MSDESNFGQFSLQTFDLTQFVRLDSAAAAALHLSAYGSDVTAINSAKSGAPRTISALLNKCRTSGGQRLLSQWIKQPLTDKSKKKTFLIGKIDLKIEMELMERTWGI